MQNCALCLKKGPHFHIIVEKGWVTSVEYISTKSYWNRELDKDEYTIGFRDGYTLGHKADSLISRFIRKLQTVKIPKPWNSGKSETKNWLVPKVYKGKSMHEEELEQQS
jgi:hypothetical protein